MLSPDQPWQGLLALALSDRARPCILHPLAGPTARTAFPRFRSLPRFRAPPPGLASQPGQRTWPPSRRQAARQQPPPSRAREGGQGVRFLPPVLCALCVLGVLCVDAKLAPGLAQTLLRLAHDGIRRDPARPRCDHRARRLAAARSLAAAARAPARPRRPAGAAPVLPCGQRESFGAVREPGPHRRLPCLSRRSLAAAGRLAAAAARGWATVAGFAAAHARARPRLRRDLGGRGLAPDRHHLVRRRTPPALPGLPSGLAGWPPAPAGNHVARQPALGRAGAGRCGL